VIVSAVAFYVTLRVVGLANTVGFHRLLTHRSFKTFPWVRNVLALLGAQYSGSPMLWIGVHRIHHTLSDTPNDPHTTRHGFWYAHSGWLANTKNMWWAMAFALSGFGLQVRFLVTDLLRLFGRYPPVWRKMTKDLQKEWFMRFLDTPLVMTGFFALQLAAAWWLGRWWGIGWLWAMHLLLNNGTWLVNSVCHWPDVGTAPEATGDRSRNVAWLSYLTHGESNHNYHHEFPTSACHGIRGGSDRSWKVIQLLGRLGLAWDIQLPAGHPDKARWVKSAEDRPQVA
jgi:fatty-acid desaturase